MAFRDIFRFSDNGTVRVDAGASAFGFGSGVAKTRSGNHVTPEHALRNPTVFACVNAIADTIAQTTVGVVSADDIGFDLKPNHPVTRMLDRPNSWQTTYELVHGIVVDMLLYGNAFVLRQGNELIPLNPDTVDIQANAAGRPTFWVDDGNVELPVDRVIHFRDFPTHTVDSPSRVLQCAELVGIDTALDQLTADILKNGNSIGGVISSDKPITLETSKQLKEAWDKAFASPRGENRGGLVALGNGFKYEPAKFVSMTDADVLNLKVQVMKRIAAIFRVPAQYLEISDGQNYNNVGQKKTSFYSDTLAPIIKNIEDKLTHRLLRDRSAAVRFDRTELVQGDLVSQAGIAVNLVTAGVWTPNEARVFTGKDPVEGADEIASRQQPQTPNPDPRGEVND